MIKHQNKTVGGVKADFQLKFKVSNSLWPVTGNTEYTQKSKLAGKC